MKNSLAVWLLFLAFPALADDAAEKAAVVNLVSEFFKAMEKRDTGTLSRIMTDDGVMYGYRESADGLQISRPTNASFIEGMGTGDRKLVERFWNPEVLLHKRIAVVWTPYDLYVDGTFSHCGVDAFNFLKTDEGWKITGIVYSMEPDGCEESPLGPLAPGSE